MILIYIFKNIRFSNDWQTKFFVFFLSIETLFKKNISTILA